MRPRLYDREWAALYLIFTIGATLIFIAYKTKDKIDPSIQNFLKKKEIEKRESFDCGK